MNCKPGDLAVIVRCDHEHRWAIGRIVRVVTAVVSAWGTIGWALEHPLVGPDGQRRDCAADRCLRPIRDQDGEDEILRLVGKPQEVTA